MSTDVGGGCARHLRPSATLPLARSQDGVVDVRGDVRGHVHKREIRVADAHEGAEERLGHLLDAAVLQAHAAQHRKADDGAVHCMGEHGTEAEAPPARNEPPSPGNAMTATF